MSAAFGPGDIHAVFAGCVLSLFFFPLELTRRVTFRLVLMTYHGTVLLLSGWQADENHILRQYRAILDRYASPSPFSSFPPLLNPTYAA